MNHSLQANSFDKAFANTWMGVHGAELDASSRPAWSTDNILQHWSAWRAVTKRQRDQARALELLKLSPRQASAASVINFDENDIKPLSTANLTRMLKRVDEAFPVPASVADDAELRKSINRLIAKLDFNYSHPVNPIQYTISEIGYDAPVASDRELKALELDMAPSFYSRLVETSPSAGFEMLTTLSERAGDRASFANLLRREVFVLDRKFALETGYSLPKFASSKDMFDFFAFWDPQAVSETYRINRFGLPKSVSNMDEFMAFIEINALEAFPAEGAYYRLGPMRTRLNQYILTTSDAEQLAKQSLRRYILWRAGENPAGVEKIFINLSNSGAVMRFMRTAVWPALHIPNGLTLRIPVVATAENYQLSRLENRPTLYPPRWNQQMLGPYFNADRIDHESKP